MFSSWVVWEFVYLRPGDQRKSPIPNQRVQTPRKYERSNPVWNWKKTDFKHFSLKGVFSQTLNDIEIYAFFWSGRQPLETGSFSIGQVSYLHCICCAALLRLTLSSTLTTIDVHHGDRSINRRPVPLADSVSNSYVILNKSEGA